MDKFDDLKRELKSYEQSHLMRRLRCTASAQGPTIFTEEGKEKILFCSNNYLSLANDPRIAEAAAECIRRFGWGSAASRLISGTMPPHLELEKEAARWFEKEAALYFSSGWSANQALLTALLKKGDLVLMDRFDHASIIDAVKSCGADFRTYRRDNPERLEKYLSEGKYHNRFIVIETVFSMDGGCADLHSLIELKNRYNAVLVADEAHGLGCFGTSGAGLAQEKELLSEIDIIVAPLGKAAASSGACIAAPRTVIDYMINRARPFIYSTAPPPACAAAALKAIRIIQQEPHRRKKLHENAKFLRDELMKMGLNIGQSDTQIIPLIVGDSHKAVQLAQQLDQKGFFITAIRPPTVPQGSARLRISVQSGHTRAQLEGLFEALRDLSGFLGSGAESA